MSSNGDEGILDELESLAIGVEDPVGRFSLGIGGVEGVGSGGGSSFSDGDEETSFAGEMTDGWRGGVEMMFEGGLDEG